MFIDDFAKHVRCDLHFTLASCDSTKQSSGCEEHVNVLDTKTPRWSLPPCWRDGPLGPQRLMEEMQKAGPARRGSLLVGRCVRLVSLLFPCVSLLVSHWVRLVSLPFPCVSLLVSILVDVY